MFKLVEFFIVLISLSTVIQAEAPHSNGYHINRPNLPFILPVKSNYRVASTNGRLRYNLPSRNYGSPQAPPPPPSANQGPPTFINTATTDVSDLGLQYPATTIQPEYSAENQNSIETFDENNQNQNGGAELGRLVNGRREKPQSAKQQVEQQPQVAFQFQIPQFQNGFAHALAVYNPEGQQQQQLIAQYQTNPAIIAQQPLVAQQQTIVEPLGQQPLAAQETFVNQPSVVAQPTLFPQQPLFSRHQTLLAQQPLLAQQTLYAQQPLAQQTLYAQQPLVAQYPQLTTNPVIAQYQVSPIQQQVFGNLQTQAILHPQYLQVQPTVQNVQPAGVPVIPETTLQPAQFQFTQSQPLVQATAGTLPSGEPFARARTGKLQAQPILRQQFQTQSNQLLGKLRNSPARQVVEIPVQQQIQQQEQQQQQQPFAYAAIGF